MLFNPSKCYKMSVFRSRSPVVKDYTLYNQTLVAVQQHPYLAVFNDIPLPIPPYYQLSIWETRNYSTNSFIQPSVHHD
ncbi:unnamed protein product [Porites evermanni]|uniref:Uncharacterized protein n=1 Tax=Porites evermanni TaxID=104178 RepID=A0ABN8M099_9CNID|nr:unnamed protein product [Porites evermanni]